MTLRIAINGFGRIGRVIARLMHSQARSNIQLVGINDLTNAQTLAHLLAFDSVHGRFAGEVQAQDNSIRVNGQSIAVSAEKDPAKLPWKALGADIVLECTGAFRTKEKVSGHFAAGAKKVLISAPADDPDLTVVYGVNHDAYDPSAHQVLSCASCTTNCLAPVAKVLLDSFGIERGTMTTVHSYTNDQNILDLPHKDLRRARAAALSMIPTTTGAAKAVGKVLPALKGKVDGFSIRVPTPNVSVVDFVAELQRDTTKEEVNEVLRRASAGPLKGILDWTDLPLVSSDFMGNTLSSTVDTLSTMVIQGRMAKVVAWYDNECGFSARMLDVVEYIGKKL
ncbi:MAG: type I glyceraldehyde-3-phosphate dehydrogenase [Bdellovibrionota bacterium]|nr:MAG: type I glyceraldehyde-3-phosphate dehydrogenase [Bdellovibrionota bacterium]